jgi:iron complex outermembrane receptor protein
MNTKVYIAMAVALASQAHAQETVLSTVDVQADTLVDANASSLSTDALPKGTPADGGEWILQVPGVSGVKMGGHGIDPVIRGQKYNQLNILLDGAYVYGGCPNRMDPPTSYASTEIYDEVTVLKGVQTLVYGSGGSGGTVLFERKPPVFEEGENVKGKYGAGYRSNGDAWDAYADVAGGSDDRYIRSTISTKEAREYEDGNGDEVRSGYKENSANVSLGMRTAGGTQLSIDLDAVRGKDILYAGAMMDSPVSDEDGIKLKIQTASVGAFEQVKFEAYRTDVHHVMDNYTLRDLPSTDLEVPSDSITDGARVTGDIAVGKGNLTIGIDMQNSDRDATRYTAATGMVQSYLWPGVEIEQTGMFIEYNGQIKKGTRYTAGLRYDSVDSSASKTLLAAMGTSPDDLYNTYYGKNAEDVSENNLGALYRMEYDLANQRTMFWGISRTVRAADATERYMAANMGMPTMIWVGNPDIESEKHNQLDIGLSTSGKNASLSFSAYIDRVRDYILRDTARGQEGILLSDGATIYRNVDVELLGIDLESSYQWNSNWSSRFTLAYVRAENTTDDRAVAQIPPLEGTASLEFHQASWMLGGEIRAVAKQTRVDDDPTTGSGLDFGETPGFTIVNFYGSYQLTKQGELKFGIDNVFDKLYAEHINKPNAFDPQPIQVNEPGRSLWARLNINF